MTNQSEDQSVPAYVLAIAKIHAELQGLSNRDIGNVMKAVGAMHNLRVIPIDRPIVPVNPIGSTRIASPPRTAVPQREKTSPPAPAEWKKNPLYLGLIAKHNTAVQKVKTSSGEDVQFRIAELRQIEEELKELKYRLQGNLEVSSLSRGAVNELLTLSPVITGEESGSSQ